MTHERVLGQFYGQFDGREHRSIRRQLDAIRHVLAQRSHSVTDKPSAHADEWRAFLL
jgi:hypothetical protein